MPAVTFTQDDWRRCEITPLPPGRSLIVTIAEGPPPLPAQIAQPDLDRAWQAVRDANPRAFNGPILSADSFDPETNTIPAQRNEYRRLAVWPTLDAGATQLGVTGVLIANDHDATPHVLLGMRSHETRVYGGCWELAPSGGVDPPPTTEDHLDDADLWRALRLEITEELGLPVEPDPARPVAVASDPIGRSLEVVIEQRLSRTVEELIAMASPGEEGEGSSRWEYEQTRWIPLDQIAAFDAAESTRIIPPTRALLRWLALA